MGPWTKNILRGLTRAEGSLDELRARLSKNSGLAHAEILPFLGMGNEEFVYFKGRVLRGRPIRPWLETDRFWYNFRAALRRFRTREIPNVTIRARYHGAVQDLRTNQEGYFEVRLKSAPSPGQEWQNAAFALVDQHGLELEQFTGRALFPPPTATFGVISDVDDTIVVSHARHIFKLAYTILTRNARGRVPFEGVAAFYRALREGRGGELNPIFYVSSSPWNLYDLLLDFFQLKNIPLGPLFLQDYGLDETKFMSASHREHKIARIKLILDMYPRLPFIFIGDSGQHDPEIYTQVLQESQNRVRAIYIRNVTGEARASKIAKLQEQSRNHGGELLLVENSLAAARHAAASGWIPESALPEIAGETRKDEAAAAQPLLKITK